MKYLTDSFVALILFLALVSVTMISCKGNAKDGTSSDSLVTSTTEIRAEYKVKNSKSIEEVSNALNGTTWHYTENLSNSDIGCWIKVEFNNGKYTSYHALPSDGKWTQDKSGNYNLKEGRYSDTGEKYISVHWVGNIKNPQLGMTIPCEMAFTADNFQLNVHSPQIDAVLYNGRGMMKQIIMKGQMEFGDYAWD